MKRTVAPVNRPNVLFILADDLGQGDVSCFNPDAAWTTPHLDRLAAEGLRLTDAHATSALCTPSRYGALTGRYNWRSALKSSVLPGDSLALIERDRPTLASLLKGQGYRTAVVGKWHLGLDWHLRADGEDLDGFGLETPEGGVPTARMGRGGNFDVGARVWREGLDIDYSRPVRSGPNDLGFDHSFITPASLDQPPYVYVEDGVPLAQPDHYDGDGERIDRLTDSMWQSIQSGPMAPDYDVHRVVSDFHAHALAVLDDLLARDAPWFLYVPSHLVHGPVIPDEPWRGRSGAGAYGDWVLQLDDYVGEMVARVDAAGAREDTIVVFTSDNGVSGVAGLEALRGHGHDPSNGWRGHKGDVWEGGHREPTIVRWPGHVAAGSTSDALVSHADLFATLAEVLGVAVPDDAAEDSVSALPVWLGEDGPTRQTLVAVAGGGGFSLRRGRWKLEFVIDGDGMDVMHADTPPSPDVPRYVPGQLYDLEADPGERENLIADHPDLVRELTEEMAEQIRRGRSTPGPDGRNHAPTGAGAWVQIGWMHDADEVCRRGAADPDAG